MTSNDQFFHTMLNDAVSLPTAQQRLDAVLAVVDAQYGHLQCVINKLVELKAVPHSFISSIEEECLDGRNE